MQADNNWNIMQHLQQYDVFSANCFQKASSMSRAKAFLVYM